MIIDVRNDVLEWHAYVKRRMDEHIAKAAKKNLPPVKMIEFGFSLAKPTGWPWYSKFWEIPDGKSSSVSCRCLAFA